MTNPEMTPEEEHEFYRRPENQGPQGPARRRRHQRRALGTLAPRGTTVYIVSESLREVRSGLPEFVERVSAHHERVVITRNGSPAAVMMSPDDLESLEETLAMLNDREAVAELTEAY